ncbi:permease [Streptococcus pneumoniae]|nr:permease [Streptococcus pneumoniae]
MLRLVYYQFLHNKKQWLGVSPVIFVSSLVMGLAVNGVINVENNSQVFVGLPDPKPIFMFPIVFGGVTLFFVLSNIIKICWLKFLEMITNFWRCWEQVAFNYHFLWGDRFLSFPRLLVLLHIYALYLLRQIIIIFYNTFSGKIYYLISNFK